MRENFLIPARQRQYAWSFYDLPRFIFCVVSLYISCSLLTFIQLENIRITPFDGRPAFDTKATIQLREQVPSPPRSPLPALGRSAPPVAPRSWPRSNCRCPSGALAVSARAAPNPRPRRQAKDGSVFLFVHVVPTRSRATISFS